MFLNVQVERRFLTHELSPASCCEAAVGQALLGGGSAADWGLTANWEGGGGGAAPEFGSWGIFCMDGGEQ